MAKEAAHKRSGDGQSGVVMRWSGGDQQGRATHFNEVSTALTSRAEANALAPSSPILGAGAHASDERKCERLRLGQCSRLPVPLEVERG